MSCAVRCHRRFLPVNSQRLSGAYKVARGYYIWCSDWPLKLWHIRHLISSAVYSLLLLLPSYGLTSIHCRFSVPHDRLFLDALERDLKREKMGHEPTTVPRGEPALSFTFDPKQSLYDQFLNQNLKRMHDEDLDNFEHRAPIGAASSIVATAPNTGLNNSVVSPADILRRRAEQVYTNGTDGTVKPDPAEEESAQKSALNNLPFFSMFSLFEGSPTYKQRRKKTTKARRPTKLASTTMSSSYEQPPTPPYHTEGGYPSALVTADSHNQSQQHLQVAQGQQPSSITLMPAHPSLAQAPALQSYGLTSNFAADEREGGAYHPRLSHSPSSVSPPIGLNANLNLAVNTSNPGVTSQKKAYLCPLYSCRLAFRRPDCLKRHIRAHRLEKPYACDRCEKRFSRPDLLQQHTLVHTHPEGMMATTLVDPTEDGMEFDVGQAFVLQDIPATQAYEDDNESGYPQPPGSAGAGSDGSGQYFAGHTPPFATHPIMHSTSTETSPYVETPQGSGWAQVRGRPTIGLLNGPNHPQMHLDVYSAAADAFGSTASTPLSINVHAASAYAQGGHIHPASAPAQKLAFNHTALYPPPPPTATQAYGVGPRHRSATPSMGRASLDGNGMQQQPGSRPQTAVSNSSGSINVGNGPYNGQFSYTIDETGAALAHPSSRGSPHSGVYGVPNAGAQEQQPFVPSPHGSFHSGVSNSPPHSLIAGHSNGSMGYTFTTGLDGYSVSQYASSLHPFVQENTTEVPAALHDSPEELHLAAAAQTIAPRYLQGGLGPASFHGSDGGSPEVYQYQTRNSGEFDGFTTYPAQMGGAQVTPHGQQLTGYHYELQQQVAL